MNDAASPHVRVLVGKPGLDGHDRGAKVVARALRDAGIEVIYTGLHQTPEQIVATAIAEDADGIGLSILSGAHMTLFEAVLGLLHERGATTSGSSEAGSSPTTTSAKLEAMGVAHIFTPGHAHGRDRRLGAARTSLTPPDGPASAGRCPSYRVTCRRPGGVSLRPFPDWLSARSCRVDLYEYQAKHLFGKHGVPVVPGAVCETPDAARLAARRIGGRVVVKAQVKTGGRGKAGGVKLAADEDEASARAGDILGLDIKGHTVHKVLVTEAADIAAEWYVSFLLDRANRSYLAMASVEGGMEIEQVAKENPDALAMIRVDALEGCTPEKAREIVEAAAFPDEVADEVVEVLKALWRVLVDEDATLVEVNPLVRTMDGRVVALDGKVTLDSNAHFRHASHTDLVDVDATDPDRAAGQGLGPQLRQARR